MTITKPAAAHGLTASSPEGMRRAGPDLRRAGPDLRLRWYQKHPSGVHTQARPRDIDSKTLRSVSQALGA